MRIILEKAKKFREEIKKTVGSSLVAAFGLVTGLAWKEVVDTYMSEILTPGQSKLITAIVITIVSVIAIMIITRILSSGEKN